MGTGPGITDGMADSQDEGGFDWVEAVVGLAGLVGMNRVRVRWKLMRWREKAAQQGRRAQARASHVRYEHKVCPRCGTINDRKAKVCVKCEDRLRSHTWQQVERVGLSVPEFLSVSSALCVANLAIYALLATESTGGLWSLDSMTLLRHGGSYPPAVWAGEWWRLGTSIFLHAGLWHIGFNVIALWQIGPSLERLYGRHRMLFFFMLTGILASLGSALFRTGGVGIGASGAIMGLIGLAAGWGQRDGTTVGRGVRNRMVKWAIYVMLFGWFIGADNVAHGAGFLAGGAIGFLVPALKPRDGALGPASMGMGGVGVIAALICAGLTVVPPGGARDWGAEGYGGGAAGMLDGWLYEQGEGDYPMTPEMWQEAYGPWAAVCEALGKGDVDLALETMRDLYPPQGSVEYRAEDLAAACEGLEQIFLQCDRFRAGGLEAAFGEDIGGLDPRQREQTERQWDGLCQGLAQIRPPASPPLPGKTSDTP